MINCKVGVLPFSTDLRKQQAETTQFITVSTRNKPKLHYEQQTWRAT